jgi:hypothetical protein
VGQGKVGGANCALRCTFGGLKRTYTGPARRPTPIPAEKAGFVGRWRHAGGVGGVGAVDRGARPQHERGHLREQQRARRRRRRRCGGRRVRPAHARRLVRLRRHGEHRRVRGVLAALPAAPRRGAWGGSPGLLRTAVRAPHLVEPRAPASGHAAGSPLGSLRLPIPAPPFQGMCVPREVIFLNGAPGSGKVRGAARQAPGPRQRVHPTYLCTVGRATAPLEPL